MGGGVRFEGKAGSELTQHNNMCLLGETVMSASVNLLNDIFIIFFSAKGRR